MRNVWFVAVPVLVGALWALLLWTPQADPGSSVSADLEAAPVEPQLPAQAVQAPAPAPEPLGPAVPTSPAPPPTSELPRMPPPPSMGPVGPLKHRYESESAPGVQPAQQLQLTAAFAGPVADLLDNVECRRTVCRVRLAWLPKHGFSGMQLLAELRRDFDPNLAVDEAGPSSASGAQSLDVFIDLTSSRPKVP